MNRQTKGEVLEIEFHWKQNSKNVINKTKHKRSDSDQLSYNIQSIPIDFNLIRYFNYY